MIAIIRIKGMVGIRKDLAETLSRLRLRRKYSCVVLVNPTKEQLGMVKKVKDFVACGEVDEKFFEKMIKARGKSLDKKKEVDAKKVIDGLIKGKKYEELNLKPFFRLHSPRGGFKSKGGASPIKTHYPKGVLGDHKEKINELIERML